MGVLGNPYGNKIRVLVEMSQSDRFVIAIVSHSHTHTLCLHSVLKFGHKNDEGTRKRETEKDPGEEDDAFLLLWAIQKICSVVKDGKMVP